MEEQKPSVGRIVHYEALGSADGKFPVGECRAAVVTAVNEDGSIAVCILNPTGMYFNQSVKINPLAEKQGGFWHWAERV